MAPSAASSQPVSLPELRKFFAGIGLRLELPEPGPNSPSPKDLEEFLAAISVHIAQAEEQQRELDRKEATRFNVFDLIEPEENKLSDVLKLLLDPRGSHGQGDLFLRLLLQQLGFSPDHLRTASARAHREAPAQVVSNQRRYIDVLVESGVLLAIENKVDAPDQPKQVKDYLGYLARRATSARQQYSLIYLTPDCHTPDSLDALELQAARQERRLHCWSYQRELRAWLDLCRDNCEAPKIRHFLSDFISYIETDLHRELQPDLEEPTDEN